MSDERLISFCTAHKNRVDSLLRLVRCLEKQEEQNLELVVADFHSDRDVTEAVKEAQIPIKVVKAPQPAFNRSRGLNTAAANASGTEEDILFFIDADMFILPDFTQLVRQHVQPNTAWFPICYSLHKNKPIEIKNISRQPKRANGWWRKEGHGMCGFTVKDFREKLKWNEGIGRTYGKEDGDMSRQAGKKGMSRYRARCESLFHIWHPIQRKGYEGNTRPTRRPPKRS